MAIAAGTLVMFLPETKGKDLHDRLKEKTPEYEVTENSYETKLWLFDKIFF